jgi:hypothetical protein
MMSQHPETVINFNQNPPRNRKAQEPGTQEELPAFKRQKQMRISPKANFEQPLIAPEETTETLRQMGQVSRLFALHTRYLLKNSV